MFFHAICMKRVKKRNQKTNIRLILFPMIFCILLVLLQSMIDTLLEKPKYKCGCICANNKTKCHDSEKVCGIQYSDQTQVVTCPIPNPPEWPPLLQLPTLSCNTTSSCYFTMLFTANNRSLGQSIVPFFCFKFQILPRIIYMKKLSQQKLMYFVDATFSYIYDRNSRSIKY